VQPHLCIFDPKHALLDYSRYIPFPLGPDGVAAEPQNLLWSAADL